MLRVLVGDSRVKASELEHDSIQLIICSPPYLNQRDYKVGDLVWGGTPLCNHQWGEKLTNPARDDRSPAKMRQDGARTGNNIKKTKFNPKTSGAYCGLCGAWRGPLGAEPDPWLYVEHLVEVFEACKPVLRPDGQLWVNLNDGWCGTGYGKGTGNFAHKSTDHCMKKKMAVPEGMKRKDLMGLPWMFAMAMRDAGWWWRAWCPWLKRSSMPDSADDRPGNALEVWLQFTKTDTYFHDVDAVRLPLLTADGLGRRRRNTDWFFESLELVIEQMEDELLQLKQAVKKGAITEGENLLGLVFNPGGGMDEHFATYPLDMILPIIKAATSEHGCCLFCKAPYTRIIVKANDQDPAIKEWKKRCGSDVDGVYTGKDARDFESSGAQSPASVKANVLANMGKRVQIGWRQTCSCELAEPVACTILDPFCGTGTSLVAAKTIGLSGIGIEIGEQHAESAIKHLKTCFGPLITVTKE